MKFVCERDVLADAVSSAQRAVVARSSALPVLGGLRLVASDGEIEIVGTDLELTIRVKVAAKVEEGGATVLPARLLGDITRALKPGTVRLEVVGTDAQITSGRSNFSVRTQPADEFPRLSEAGGKGVTVAATALAEALRQVVPAASSDDARPILTGVLFTTKPGALQLVATDSYRLAVRSLPGVSMLEEGQRVLVPAKALREVERLLGNEDIEVRLAEREVSFCIGAVTVTARLIEGEFPNYEQLIPTEYPNRLTVNRDVLGEAVKRVRLMSQGRENTPIRLALGPSSIELSAVAQELGQASESFDAKYEGSEMTVAFNPQFLLDGIQATPTDDVVLATLDPLKPATLSATDSEDFLYLLMPVRIP